MSRNRLNLWILYWFPWYLYLALIFFLSSIPRPDQTFGVEIKDYLAHPVEYLPLPILTFRAFRNSPFDFVKHRFFTLGILFCIFYAASDEFHQLFVPHRSGCLQDVMYDLIGIILGRMLYHFWAEKKSGGYLSA